MNLVGVHRAAALYSTSIRDNLNSETCTESRHTYLRICTALETYVVLLNLLLNLLSYYVYIEGTFAWPPPY